MDLQRSWQDLGLRCYRRGRCLLIFVLLALPLSATTYYVNCNGSDSNNGTSTSAPWQTISKVNTSSFSAGDSILFQKGCTWREALTILTSAGSAGNPITYGAYGTGAQPIITGADLITGWSQYSGSIYQAIVTTQPKRVWHASTELTYSAGNKNSLTNNQFDWAANVLYVNIGQNPTGQTMEATQRGWPVQPRKNYLVIDGLHATKANNTNIASADVATNHVTIQNCTSDYSGNNGMYFGSDSVTIGNFTIQNNTISNNGLRLNLDHGIYLEHSASNVISGNYFQNNAGYGVQIQDSSNNNAVTGNSFESNRTGAIVIWDNSGSDFPTGNNILANVSNGDVNCFVIGGSTSTVSNTIVNNTCYGFTANGLKIYNSPNFGVFKNNIFWSTVASVSVIDDEGTAATMSSDYNLMGPEGIRYSWHGTSSTAIADFKVSSGTDAHSIASDPKFNNAAGSDFTLQAGSSAIDAGTNLGSSYQLGLNPRTSFPWGTLNQNSQGSGWEIGAFVFVQQIPPAPPTSLSATVE